MKIVIVTGIYPPELGGPAIYVKKIVQLFKQIGWKVQVLTYGEPRPNVHTVSRAHTLPVRMFLFTWKLFKLTKKAGAILLLDYFSAGLPTFFVSKILRKPIVSRIGGLFAYEEETKRALPQRSIGGFLKGKKTLLISFLYWVQGIILRNSAFVIPTSGFFEEVCKLQKVEEEKIKLIVTAPTITMVSKTKEELRKELGFSNGVYYLLSCSRLIPHKGVAGLIRTMLFLPETFRLLIIGEGEQEPMLHKLVKQLKLGNRVSFLGKFPQEKFQPYLKAADAYVLNSRYEGLSNIAVESMALETPVFLSKVEGNIHLVIDGQNGFLFPFNKPKAIAQTILQLQNSELMQTIKEKAKNSVNTWENVFSRTKKLLEQAAKGEPCTF